VFPGEFAVGFTVMLHGGSTCATLKVFSVQVHGVVVCGLVVAVLRRREGVVAAARWCSSLLHGGVAVCFTEVWQFASRRCGSLRAAAAVAVQTVEAKLVQPWLLREEEDGCAIRGGGTGAVLVWRWWWRRRCCRRWWLPACVLAVVFATSARTEKMVALSRFRSAAVLVVAADGVALVVLRRHAGRKENELVL